MEAEEDNDLRALVYTLVKRVEGLEAEVARLRRHHYDRPQAEPILSEHHDMQDIEGYEPHLDEDMSFQQIHTSETEQEEEPVAFAEPCSSRRAGAGEDGPGDVVDLTFDSPSDEDIVGEDNDVRPAKRLKVAARQSTSPAQESSSSEVVEIPSSDQGSPDEVQIVEEEDTQELLEGLGVPSNIASKLKPHQRTGCKFLLDILRDNRGCVVGDAMGLGKSLQMLASLHAFIHSRMQVTRVLMVVPTTLIGHWDAEVAKFNSWLSPGQLRLPAPHIIASTLSPSQRLDELHSWTGIGDTFSSNRGRDVNTTPLLAQSSILVLGYDMFRELVSIYEAQAVLCREPGPDVLILDEGHRIRNLNSSTNNTLAMVETQRKIVLSGYPMQNNLTELYSMIDFVMPDECRKVLGTLKAFQFRFQKTIARWRKSNKLKKSRRRAWLLFDLLRDHRLLLRRDATLLYQDLPPFTSVILKVAPSPLQKRLYSAFLQHMPDAQAIKGALDIFAVTSMISDHPEVARRVANSASSGPSAPDSDSDTQFSKYLRRPWLSAVLDQAQQETVLNLQSEEHSGKMAVLLSIILESKKAGDQLVVFSRWLHSLSFVQEMIGNYNRTLAIAGESTGFIHASRFDGRTALLERQSLIDNFMQESSTADVMLISTLCGEGISLVSANRVVILDVNWNPSHDHQAALRVFRYGQKKPVVVYRFVQDGGIEDLVFRRQLLKVELANWVLDRSVSNASSVSEKLPSWGDYIDQAVAELNSSVSLEEGGALIDLSDASMQDPVTKDIIENHSVAENGVVDATHWIVEAAEQVSMFDEVLEKDEAGEQIDFQRAAEEYEWDMVYEPSRERRSHTTVGPSMRPETQASPVSKVTKPVVPPSEEPSKSKAAAVPQELSMIKESTVPDEEHSPPHVPAGSLPVNTEQEPLTVLPAPHNKAAEEFQHPLPPTTPVLALASPAASIVVSPGLPAASFSLTASPSSTSPFVIPMKVCDPLRAYQRHSGESPSSVISPSAQSLTAPDMVMSDLQLDQSFLAEGELVVSSGGGLESQNAPHHQHGRMKRQLDKLKKSDHFAKLAEQRKRLKEEQEQKALRVKARLKKKKAKRQQSVNLKNDQRSNRFNSERSDVPPARAGGYVASSSGGGRPGPAFTRDVSRGGRQPAGRNSQRQYQGNQRPQNNQRPGDQSHGNPRRDNPRQVNKSQGNQRQTNPSQSNQRQNRRPRSKSVAPESRNQQSQQHRRRGESPAASVASRDRLQQMKPAAAATAVDIRPNRKPWQCPAASGNRHNTQRPDSYWRA